MNAAEFGGRDPEPPVERDLDESRTEEIEAPFGKGEANDDAPLGREHGDLPERYRGHGQIRGPVRAVGALARGRTEDRVVLVEPDQHMGVEQDQPAASHSSPMGETMSPTTAIIPR